MILGIDLKVDFVFKRVFGVEKYTKVLASLLNSVLKDAGSEFGPIVKLELRNPFLEKERGDDKLAILDIKACDQEGRWFNVEMQMLLHTSLLERLLYYWARLFAAQMEAGDGWQTLEPTITVCFVNGTLFPDVKACHSMFRLVDPRHKHCMTNRLEIHIVELPKFQTELESLAEDIDLWLYFLRHAEMLDSDAIPAALQQPEILTAVKELAMIAQDTREQQLYEAHMREMGERSALWHTGHVEGHVEGRLEGLDEGIMLGILMNSIQIEEKRLGLPVTTFGDLRTLTVDELNSMLKTLNEKT